MPIPIRRTIPYEMRRLGTYLERLREEAGFSLRNVTEKCGISASYLHKIERGDSFATLNIHTLIKLSQFYNISVATLLTEAGLIDHREHELPDLAQYLREKYGLSPQAIRDMEMAKEIVDRKYQTRRI